MFYAVRIECLGKKRFNIRIDGNKIAIHAKNYKHCFVFRFGIYKLSNKNIFRYFKVRLLKVKKILKSIELFEICEIGLIMELAETDKQKINEYEYIY